MGISKEAFCLSNFYPELTPPRFYYNTLLSSITLSISSSSINVILLINLASTLLIDLYERVLSIVYSIYIYSPGMKLFLFNFKESSTVPRFKHKY